MAKSFSVMACLICVAMSASPNVVHGVQSELPPSLAQQLNALLQGSVDGGIDPGIYMLAAQNSVYADEIACLSVQFYGQPDVIEREILKGISDPVQQAAVRSAVSECSRKDGETFNRGLVGGDVNTLSNTQDTTSPIAP